MLILVWPVGVPLLFAALLWCVRSDVQQHRPTPLASASSFLHHEFTASCYYWELIETVSGYRLVRDLPLVKDLPLVILTLSQRLTLSPRPTLSRLLYSSRS